MATNTCFLPWHMQTTGLLTVTPVLGAFRVADDYPPTAPAPAWQEPPEGMLPFTFWVDGHPVASRWYGTEVYRQVRTSALFAEPLRLVSLSTYPEGTPGWMRTDVCAVGDSHRPGMGDSGPPQDPARGHPPGTCGGGAYRHAPGPPLGVDSR